jgi:CheY-like chemotaxis protein
MQANMPSVLIIEDDPEMCTLEGVALEFRGYHVTTATNGAEGLRRLRDATPSVILLDMMMPVMDGLTFLAQRLEEGVALDVPVICVSASGSDVLAQARRLGAVECVPKPADLDALCDMVTRHCRPL